MKKLLNHIEDFGLAHAGKLLVMIAVIGIVVMLQIFYYGENGQEKREVIEGNQEVIIDSLFKTIEIKLDAKDSAIRR